MMKENTKRKGKKDAAVQEQDLKNALKQRIATLEILDRQMIDLSGISLEESFVKQLESEWNKKIGDGTANAKDCLKASTIIIVELQQKVKECFDKFSAMKAGYTRVSKELQSSKEYKEKLEELCRGLQKHNKLMKQNNAELVEQELKKRDDMNANFQKTIDDVGKNMKEQEERNKSIYEENNSLREKLSSFIESYESVKKQFDVQIEKKDLENQLLQAQFKQQEHLANEMKEQLHEAMKGLVLAKKNEEILKEQTQLYDAKFTSFQSTIEKSNETFTLFKSRISQLEKHNKLLEKANASYQKKCKTYDEGALEEIQKQVDFTKALADEKKKVAQLSTLCRSLQTDRDQLKTLCENHGLRPSNDANREKLTPKQDNNDPVAVEYANSTSN